MCKKYNRILIAGSGFTIIELMISVVISAFILSGITEIYLITQRNVEARHGLQRIQENAQQILSLLSVHIRMAGFLGCAKLTGHLPFKNHTSLDVTNENKLTFYTGTDRKPGTDGLTVWHAHKLGALLHVAMRDYSEIEIQSNLSFLPKDIVILSDCQSVEIVQIDKIFHPSDGKQTIKTTTPLTKLYGENSELIKLDKITFFVGETGRYRLADAPHYGLFMQDERGRKNELVQGVDRMMIQFDSNNLNHQIQGVILEMMLSDEQSKLKKKWYGYVALREI